GAAAAQQILDISTTARAMQQGDVVRLDVVCRCERVTGPGTAFVFGHEVPLAPEAGRAAWTGLIGIDLDTRPGRHDVRVAVELPEGAPVVQVYTFEVRAKAFPTRQLTVAPRYVEPPADQIQRILAEDRRLDAMWEVATTRAQVGPFQAPVTVKGRNTFGARSVFNGQARNPHAGVDFSSPTGTPVAAPAAGRVALAEDLYFTGRTVILNHGRGLYSVLAHLSRLDVREGDEVTRGQTVGAVGATGRATGPHLHWGTRLLGARVDPLSLVELLAP
ncbi:MAG: M23 family metallopeptidase, partial [Acidimicrobiia bacterium]|nr:M23 family metallopeptidase [Acidimicrobiia bacterium]